jgi:hypothetical protein
LRLIVIGLHGAQIKSRFSGIGCSTLSLAKAIIRNSGEYDVLVTINGLLLEPSSLICAAIDDRLSPDWHAISHEWRCLRGA